MISKSLGMVTKSLRLRPERREAQTVAHLTILNLTRNTQLADHAELAGNGPDRRKGLLGRASLARGEGLWIVPCEAVHTFCMRFPIDLVYVDRLHRVVKTRTQVKPWRLSGCLRAHSVIELPEGTIQLTQTMPGDLLHLSLGL